MISKTGILTIILAFGLTETAQSDVAATETAVEKSVAGTVARTAFTTEVVEREPVDRLESIPEDLDKVYFFTEFVDMTGESVVHRWLYDGEIVAEVPIEIGGPRWRAYSIKTLAPQWNDGLVVQVIDGEGQVLEEAQLVSTPQTGLTASEPVIEAGS